MNKFFNLIEEAASNRMLETILGAGGLGVLGGFLLYAGIAMLSSSFWFVLLILLGLVPLFLAFLFFRSIKTGAYWINILEKNPEEIIWIMPIVEKHTIGLVINLYKEKKFQLFTIDGKSLTIKCNSKETQDVFFEGIKEYLPKAHIGYTPHLFKVYGADKVNFISNLIKYDGYNPVENI